MRVRDVLTGVALRAWEIVVADFYWPIFLIARFFQITVACITVAWNCRLYDCSSGRVLNKKRNINLLHSILQVKESFDKLFLWFFKTFWLRLKGTYNEIENIKLRTSLNETLINQILILNKLFHLITLIMYGRIKTNYNVHIRFDISSYILLNINI